MLRSSIVIFCLFAAATATAQDMLFDDIHQNDGAVFVKTVNGEETLVDASGTPVPLNDVYRMELEERIERGFTTAVNGGLSNASRSADPTLVFNLTFLDQVNGTGKGFDDPVLGQQRRAVLEAAFSYYAATIENIGVCDVEIRESFSGNPNSNPFAYSAAYYFGSKGFNQPFTQAHIVNGSDPYDAYPDAYMQFNFNSGLNYNYDRNAQPSAQQYDFYTVVMHEIMHILGFSSYSTASGESAASPQVFTSFDEYLKDYTKAALFEVSGSGSSTVVNEPDNATLTNNQVWFELYSGVFAPVFSPNPFNASSIDHFDNSRSDHGGYVMHPTLSKGDAFKLLQEDEVRVLEILGYTVNYSIATAIEDGFSSDAPLKVTSGLYPNPAYTSDPVRIDIGDVKGDQILVIVYDMLGKQSYSKVILNSGPGPVTAIDPYQNLAPGMYIVIGSTKDELFNEKLVIR
ncbi:MAG: T9SS type A sorting domain-containing protein [Flavobacteriales bacterium]|nr:T9SS type A sorting domain-containing protein [Flavobacteriales bacterium]